MNIHSLGRFTCIIWLLDYLFIDELLQFLTLFCSDVDLMMNYVIFANVNG